MKYKNEIVISSLFILLLIVSGYSFSKSTRQQNIIDDLTNCNRELIKINDSLIFKIGYQLDNLIKTTSKMRLFLTPMEVTVYAHNATKDQLNKLSLIAGNNNDIMGDIVTVSSDIEKLFNLKFGDTLLIIANNEIVGRFEFNAKINNGSSQQINIFMKNNKRVKDFGTKQAYVLIKKINGDEIIRVGDIWGT